MKEIIWMGDTHIIICKCPKEVKQEIGYNLDRVQRGLEPCDWKPIPEIGPGAQEIRIHETNEYRIIYVAKFKEAIYVLHSFVKKTQKTSQKDIDISKKRYSEMLQNRRCFI